MYQNPEVSFSPLWETWNCFPLIRRRISLDVVHSGVVDVELAAPSNSWAVAAGARYCSDERFSLFRLREVRCSTEDMRLYFLLYGIPFLLLL